MSMDNLPVTLGELKAHLRIYTNEMDGTLSLLLAAAVSSIEMFTSIKFKEDYIDVALEVPYALKASILLLAGRLFENPTDKAESIPTISRNLAEPFRRWDRIRE